LPERELVRAVNLSPSHLRRLFKAEVGMSTSRYMKLLRMEQAKYLFETSFLSVKEVMRTVGINNRSHFVKDFKKLYGGTPTQLRLSRLADGHTTTTPPATGKSALAGS
jgi:AraC-like DNA-binding protein